MVTIVVEDIYFFTRLSRRGAPISLSRYHRGGETVNDYVATYCVNSQPRKGGNIKIKKIHQLPLKTILFNITQLDGSTTHHLATKTQMQYALECLAPTIFN